MKTYRLPKVVSDADAEKLAGTFLTNEAFDLLLRDEDADVYDEQTGRPLLKFRKGVFDAGMVATTFNALKEAARSSENRGMAGGKVDPKMVNRKGKVVVVGKKGTRYQYVTERGELTNTNYANKVNSGIIGYFDRYPRIPYCRQTSFNAQQAQKFTKALPLIRKVDEVYSQLVPEHYRLQREKCDKTSQDFVIKGTAFTTITVNKNWQTAVHKDIGDFPDGFGNLVVMRLGDYEGGCLVMPQWRCAADLQNGDLLLMDVHQWHGNTALKAKSVRQFFRLSLVMYYRDDMIKCGTAEQELERAKKYGASGVSQSFAGE